MARYNSKEKYLQMIYDLFRRRGLNLTMVDIAEELKLTKKTLYNNFNNKEELIMTVAHRIFHDVEEQINHSLTKGKNAIEGLYKTSGMMNKILLHIGPLLLSDTGKYLPDLKMLDHTNRLSFNSKIVSENLSRGISEGLYRSDLNEELVVLFFTSSLAKMYAWDGAYIYLKDPYKFHSELIRYHLEAVVNEKGRKILRSYIKGKKNSFI